MRNMLGRMVTPILVMGVMGMVWTGSASGQDDDVQTTLEALKQRVRDQDRRIAELEASRQAELSQQARRDEILSVLKELNVDAAQRGACPAWLEDLKFNGDFRLRYQGDCFDWGQPGESDKKSRNRARFRLRFGFTKSWLDEQLEVGFRLASGSNNDPTSTNQTFGESGDDEPPFAKRPIWIDLAYARFAPKACKGFEIVGGKMKNPFLTNEIFMDTDVNPEGVWAGYICPKAGPVELFGGAGYFILTERGSGHDAIMAGYQAGMNWAVSKDVKYTLASYVMDYDDYSSSKASARGNDSPLSDIPGFLVVGVTNQVKFKAFDLPFTLFADWARNCDNQDSDPDYDKAENAYAVGLKVGENKKKGDWSVKYRYARVEANSLPGQFVDADFGFANRRGHVIGGEYNLLDNLTAGLNVLITEPIFTPTSASGASPVEDTTVIVQADLVWKF